MTAEQREYIKNKWCCDFVNIPPIAWCVREFGDLFYLRMHNFLGMQRYPEDKNDFAKIFIRQKRFSEFFAKEGEDCTIIYALPDNTYRKRIFLLDKKAFEKIDGWKQCYSKGEFQAEVRPFQFYALRDTWSFERYSQIIYDLADDVIGSVIFWNIESGFLYCPYDGGAVLLYQDESMAIQIAQSLNDIFSLEYFSSGRPYLVPRE